MFEWVIWIGRFAVPIAAVALIVLVATGVSAVGAWLRLQYYERRNRRQYAVESAAQARRDTLRAECSRLWWEGQK